MIIGHNKQRDFLKKIKKGNISSNSFLLSGDEGIGKKKVALEAVSFLNCSSLNPPCHNCSSCKGIYRDFFLLEKEEEIKIGEIKELLSSLTLSPEEDKFKIGIIDNAHLMNKEAQNCLLKSLEEPRKRTLFFLITSYPSLLLKTILSRLWEIKFYPLKKEEIMKLIQNEEDKEKIASLSMGRPGILMDILKGDRLEKINKVEEILSSNLYKRFNFAKEISEKKEALYFLENTIFFLREKLLSSFDSKETMSIIKEDIERVLEARKLAVSTNTNKRLLLENLFINICTKK